MSTIFKNRALTIDTPCDLTKQSLPSTDELLSKQQATFGRCVSFKVTPQQLQDLRDRYRLPDKEGGGFKAISRADGDYNVILMSDNGGAAVSASIEDDNARPSAVDCAADDLKCRIGRLEAQKDLLKSLSTDEQISICNEADIEATSSWQLAEQHYDRLPTKSEKEEERKLRVVTDECKIVGEISELQWESAARQFLTDKGIDNDTAKAMATEMKVLAKNLLRYGPDWKDAIPSKVKLEQIHQDARNLLSSVYVDHKNKLDAMGDTSWPDIPRNITDASLIEMQSNIVKRSEELEKTLPK